MEQVLPGFDFRQCRMCQSAIFNIEIIHGSDTFHDVVFMENICRIDSRGGTGIGVVDPVVQGLTGMGGNLFSSMPFPDQSGFLPEVHQR